MGRNDNHRRRNKGNSVKKPVQVHYEFARLKAATDLFQEECDDVGEEGRVNTEWLRSF